MRTLLWKKGQEECTVFVCLRDLGSVQRTVNGNVVVLRIEIHHYCTSRGGLLAFLFSALWFRWFVLVSFCSTGCECKSLMYL